MTKNFIIIFLLVMIKVPGFAQSADYSKELAVINDTFLGIVGTGYYLMPLPDVPLPPIHPDSLYGETEDSEPITIELDGVEYPSSPINEDSLREVNLRDYENFDWENYYEKIREVKAFLKNRPLDTANLVVLVQDSLFDYPRDRISHYILTEEGFKLNFEVDGSWRALAVKVVDSLKQTVEFPLSKITKTGKYHLATPQNYKEDSRDRVVGIVKISRVALNEQESRACFIFSFYCGGHCGEGVMVFAEKLNGQWVIVGRRQLWVS